MIRYLLLVGLLAVTLLMPPASPNPLSAEYYPDLEAAVWKVMGSQGSKGTEELVRALREYPFILKPETLDAMDANYQYLATPLFEAQRQYRKTLPQPLHAFYREHQARESECFFMRIWIRANLEASFEIAALNCRDLEDRDVLARARQLTREILHTVEVLVDYQDERGLRELDDTEGNFAGLPCEDQLLPGHPRNPSEYIRISRQIIRDPESVSVIISTDDGRYSVCRQPEDIVSIRVRSSDQDKISWRPIPVDREICKRLLAELSLCQADTMCSATSDAGVGVELDLTFSNGISARIRVESEGGIHYVDDSRPWGSEKKLTSASMGKCIHDLWTAATSR